MTKGITQGEDRYLDRMIEDLRSAEETLRSAIHFKWDTIWEEL